MECNGPAERGGTEGATAITRLRGSGLFDAAFYTRSDPDLAGLGDRALAHYFLQGWREGRRPNFYFDPGWYLAQYEDVRAAGIEPLLHYLIAGEAEGRRPCPLFDPAWYGRAHGISGEENRLAHLLAHRREGRACAIAEFDAPFYLRTYPDIAEAGIDPFEHYLVQGFREARRPFDGFDPQWYRGRYLRGLPEANPLLHWVAHRGEPGIHPSLPAGETTVAREVKRRTGRNEAFEGRAPVPADAPRRARVLAYYLPQYHPIPENDAWWGDGFTEWTNIARVLPRFAGHYQPRVPRDLGHYRLEGEAGRATMARQIEFARGAGIEGFVFYFYWFAGRRLLDGPLEALLADPSLDMPFCLMWANENWTRRWDGSEDEILIGQGGGAEEEADLLACFARHFADPRYIRIGGRPLLMVYRPALILQAAGAVARWRRAFAPEDPILVMSQSFGDLDPRPFGFDGAIEFPPHKICEGLPVLNPTLDILDHEFHAHVFDYAEVARASVAEPAPAFPLIKTAVPSWDNDARRQGGGLVVHGSTPALYEDWLERLVLRASDHPFFGEPIVCVNAWNEWAEGAYLEPDLHFGAAYLNATGRAVTGAEAAEPVLLVGHDGLRHGAQLLLLHLARHLVRVHGAAVEILLLAPGPLSSAFAALGPTAVMGADDPGLEGLIGRFRREGGRAAIVNSLAAGGIVPALRARGIRCVLLAHEMPVLLAEKGLTGIAGAALAGADEVVVAAQEVADALARATGFEEGRATVLPQGSYSPVRFCPVRREAMRARIGVGTRDLLVLGIGYADLRKGFDLFLQLRRLLSRAKRGVAVHLVWAGGIDPTLRAYLEAEIAEAVGTGRFHLPGFVEAPEDLFSAADVLALPSREDPYPSVVLEAIGAGLEVVAFDGAGGIPALLASLRSGTSVRPGDLPGFAEALLRHAVAGTGPGEREARIGRAPPFAFGAYAHRLLGLARPALLDISAAVLSYNYAAYMDERMASVLGQTYPVREVLVLDDASTDDSVARARAAAAERTVEIVVSPANSGSPFCQWRAAAERAQGEWIWLAEADDSAEPGFLRTLAARIASEPDAVLAFCDSRVIDGEGRPLGSSYQAYYGQACGEGTKTLDLSRSGVFDGPSFLRAALGERNLILNASAVLFRRRSLLGALERCREELATLRVAGDWRIYAEILGAPGGKVIFEARPLNIHRRHEASVTHRLAARRHLVEIGQVHAAVARIGGLGEAEKARQRAYRASLRAQFGLRAAGGR